MFIDENMYYILMEWQHLLFSLVLWNIGSSCPFFSLLVVHRLFPGSIRSFPIWQPAPFMTGEEEKNLCNNSVRMFEKRQMMIYERERKSEKKEYIYVYIILLFFYFIMDILITLSELNRGVLLLLVWWDERGLLLCSAGREEEKNRFFFHIHWISMIDSGRNLGYLCMIHIE